MYVYLFVCPFNCQLICLMGKLAYFIQGVFHCLGLMLHSDHRAEQDQGL